MRNFDEEMKRGLDDVVKRTNSSEWVNDEDKLARQFRATPVSQHEYEEKVEESVDGLPVKDRDLVDDDVTVEAVSVGDEPKRTVTESGEVVSGDVPEGTVRETMEWVGDDKDRAQQALNEEEAKDSPRKSLVEKLKEVIGE